MSGPDLDWDVVMLRQALWGVYEVLGFDTDGAATPAGVANLRETVVKAANEFRHDYDAALARIEELEDFIEGGGRR